MIEEGVEKMEPKHHVRKGGVIDTTSRDTHKSQPHLEGHLFQEEPGYLRRTSTILDTRMVAEVASSCRQELVSARIITIDAEKG